MDTFNFIITAQNGEARETLITQLKDEGVPVVRVYENLECVFVINTTWKVAGSLRSNPLVADLERDSTFGVSREIVNPANWGLDRIDQRSRPMNGRFVSTRTGSRTDIYIIDTGIDSRHPEFGGRVTPLWDFRASMTIGSASGTRTIYFPLNANLATIVNCINVQFGQEIALEWDNKLRINAAGYAVNNAPGSFANFIQTAFGMSPQSGTIIMGTIENPTITTTLFPLYGEDDHNHGTHVAGIAAGETYGVASSAKLYSIKCFSSSAQALTSTIIEALNFTIGHHNSKGGARPSVANMSFGGDKSPAMDNVVLSMMSGGILCCVAAGNSSTNAFDVSPAGAGAVSNIEYRRDGQGELVLDSSGNPIVEREYYTFNENKPIVVAACNNIDQFANFSNYSEDNFTLAGTGSSNYGSVVDIIAPGVQIVSARRGERGTSRTGVIFSGTSMATPHVAGVAALYLDAGDVSPQSLRQQMIDDSTKDVISFGGTPALAKDRTPNRLLYMPFSETSFYWMPSTSPLTTVDEGNSVSVTVRAVSLDSNSSNLVVKYNVTAQAPVSGQVVSIPNTDGLLLHCDTGLITGQAPSVTSDLTLTFDLWAFDDRDRFITKTFTIRVLRKNVAPVWVTPGGHLGNFVEGDAVSLILEASDSDNDTIRYSVLNGELPPGVNLSASTGEIFGSITNVHGGTRTYNFTVRATDGVAVADRAFSMSVSESNQPPNWNQDWLPPEVYIDGRRVRSFGTFNIGDYVDIKAMAIDPDEDPLTFSVAPTDFVSTEPDRNGELPDGLVLDRAKGRISGVISPRNTPGRYFFSLWVRDGFTHTNNNGQPIDPPLKENFYFEVTDTTSTVQVINGISYDADQNPRAIASILGGSRVIRVSARVLSPFTGINPRMKIGDNLNYGRLMNFGDAVLTSPGVYTTYPNFKYNQVGNVDLHITFEDDSVDPQYNVTIQNTRVTSISIISPGTGFRTAPIPDIRFGGGAGARAISFLKAVSCRLVSGGSGYRIGDTLRIVGGSTQMEAQTLNGVTVSVEKPIRINVTNVDAAGKITGFTMTDSGTYLVAPDNPAETGGGIPGTNSAGELVWNGASGIGATFRLDFGVKDVQITQQGQGYLTPPDVYFGGNGITSGSIQLEIEYIRSDVTVFFGNIKWVTPSGLLGYINETDSSPFSVKAVATGGSPVTYALAPGSGPLPIGLTLDSVTGEIRGSSGFTDQDTPYTFTVRASVGATFVDRTFTIIMRNLFNSKPVTGVYMLMSGFDRQKWLSYVNQNVPDTAIFRATDPEYGIVSDPQMYILFGMPEMSEAEFWRAISGRPDRPHEYDYHQKIHLFVGDLKTAVARGLNGEILYEVIYRDIVDPLDHTYERRGGSTIDVRAGGFKGGNSLERHTVPYPQAQSRYNVDNIQFIYPASIRNMRKDLLAQDSEGIGIRGSEALPLWMRSEQVKGRPQSILGFIPAVVLAYVKPGEGEKIIRNIRQRGTEDDILGTKLTFDRYFMVKYASTETTFDIDMVVPDPDQYPLVATRNDVNAPGMFTPRDLYVYTDQDSNPLTPDTFNLPATKLAIQAAAQQHATNNGRAEPEMSDDWRESDYRPHENINGSETVFDEKATLFDYVIYKTGHYFKFPPGDKR